MRRIGPAPNASFAAEVQSAEPTFIADDSLKADTNPAGLVSCAVRVWQYAHEQWIPITGVARWDELAPLRAVWVALLAFGCGATGPKIFLKDWIFYLSRSNKQ
jgi:hypothetical protein